MAFCIPQSILGTIYPPWFYHWSLFLRASELPLIQPFFGVLPSLFSHTRCTVSLPRRRSFWHNCTFSQDVTPICFSPSPPFKKYKGRVWIEKPVIVRNFPVPFLVFHLHFLLFCCKIKGQYDLSKFTALSAVLGAPTPGAVFCGSKISKIKNRDKFYTVEFRIDYIFIDTRISCGIIKNVKSILNVVLNWSGVHSMGAVIKAVLTNCKRAFWTVLIVSALVRRLFFFGAPFQKIIYEN